MQRTLAQPRANRRQAGGAALLPETAAFLRAFYAPYNAQLAYWLADDRWLWEDVHAAQHTAASNLASCAGVQLICVSFKYRSVMSRLNSTPE